MVTDKQPDDVRMAENVASAGNHGYLEWGPVFGGAVVTLAASVVLLNFGAGIGLAIDAPMRGVGAAPVGGVIATGIWLVWVPLVSAMAGGYIAGAMRRPLAGATPVQVEFRDGVHGLIVWAVSTLAAVAGAAFITAITVVGADATAAVDPETVVDPEIVRKAGVIFGFVTAAGAALSAGVAWWAATLGGEHRDEQISVYDFVPGFLRSR